jgi:hypothetical protein
MWQALLKDKNAAFIEQETCKYWCTEQELADFFFHVDIKTSDLQGKSSVTRREAISNITNWHQNTVVLILTLESSAEAEAAAKLLLALLGDSTFPQAAAKKRKHGSTIAIENHDTPMERQVKSQATRHNAFLAVEVIDEQGDARYHCITFSSELFKVCEAEQQFEQNKKDDE